MGDLLIQIVCTGWWFFILSIVWQVLELLFYKEVQPRIVDDIMMLLFLPFIWVACGR